MQIVVEVADNKADLFLEFIRSLSFVKRSEKVEGGSISNPELIQSIEDYESGKVQPQPFDLNSLKAYGEA